MFSPKHNGLRYVHTTACVIKLYLHRCCCCCCLQVTVRLSAQHLRRVLWPVLPRIQPATMETRHDLQRQRMWTWVRPDTRTCNLRSVVLTVKPVILAEECVFLSCVGSTELVGLNLMRPSRRTDCTAAAGFLCDLHTCTSEQSCSKALKVLKPGCKNSGILFWISHFPPR